MRKLILLFVLFLLLIGCSTQKENVESSTTTSTASTPTQNKYNIREGMKSEALEIYKVIYTKAEKGLPLSEQEFNQLVKFAEKYTKENYQDFTQDEDNLRSTLISLDEANAELIMAKLNQKYTEQDKWEKELGFQLAKTQTLLGIE